MFPNLFEIFQTSFCFRFVFFRFDRFPIDISRVPWQAAMSSAGFHFCAASIISDKWLLTAAHCTNGMPASEMTLRIGSTINSGGGTLYKPKRIIQHNQFISQKNDFDFSLIELINKIEFNDTARPITLPEEGDQVKDNTTCLVTGWGDSHSSGPGNILRGAEVPIVNQDECEVAYWSFKRITPRMLCAGFDEGGIH